MNIQKITSYILSIVLICGLVLYVLELRALKYGAPPYVEEDDTEIIPQSEDPYVNWKRPDGPIKIGLQVGHYKREEMPDELARIRDRGGGTRGQGYEEWEVILKIAEESAKLLEKEGYIVDILPATVPTNYWADAFVAIHADGNINPLVRGFKVAPSARDRTGKADDLSEAIETTYQDVTKLDIDPNITRNMTRYYAFNYRRYDHSIHPMTPGVLVETGFLTNPTEARMLINYPQLSAFGIAKGIVQFIENSDIQA